MIYVINEKYPQIALLVFLHNFHRIVIKLFQFKFFTRQSTLTFGNLNKLGESVQSACFKIMWLIKSWNIQQILLKLFLIVLFLTFR